MHTQISRRGFLATVPAALLAAKPTSIRVGCQANAWPLKTGDFQQLLGVLFGMEISRIGRIKVFQPKLPAMINSIRIGQLAGPTHALPQLNLDWQANLLANPPELLRHHWKDQCRRMLRVVQNAVRRGNKMPREFNLFAGAQITVEPRKIAARNFQTQ